MLKLVCLVLTLFSLASITSAECSNQGSCLAANTFQPACKDSGLERNAAPGYARSATDDANFINFCRGKTLTNGKRLQEESCNGVVMGDIPSVENMISTIITSPGLGENIPAHTNFTIKFQVLNLVAGFYTNPVKTFYSAPQALEDGKIMGHVQVAIQSLGDMDTMMPPDPTKYVYFHGVLDQGDGQGGLNSTVTGGLPAGVYRVCTMVAAANHQPVVMPVQQRGAQDDCQKFTVGA